MTRATSIQPDVQDAAERWLLAHGYPYLVVPRHRARRLVSRVAPVLAALVLFDAIGVVSDLLPPVSVTDEAAGIGLLAVAAVALLVMPVLGGVLVARSGRGRPRLRTVVGIALLAAFVAVDPFLRPDDEGGAASALILNAVVAGLLLAATALGFGSLIAWAFRSSIRQTRALGRLTSRALPLLMLVVLFALYSQETWQMTDALTPGRLLIVIGFFALLGLAGILPVARRELGDLDGGMSAADVDRRLTHEGFPPRLNDSPVRPTGRLERANLWLALVVAQSFQISVFAFLVFVFLTLLASVSVDSSVIEIWINRTEPPGEILGIPAPVGGSVIKVALFLSAISALNFTVSVSTDKGYREAFYEPLLDEMRAALAVRSMYLSR